MKTIPGLGPAASTFKSLKTASNRTSLASRLVTDDLVKKILKDRRDVTVAEFYAGPGLLTRSLIRHDNVKKVVAMESQKPFAGMVKSLAESNDKVVHCPQTGYSWQTWTDCLARGDFGPLDQRPWTDPIRDDFLLVGTIPSSREGNQLVSQYLRTMYPHPPDEPEKDSLPYRTWMYHFGRIEMVWVLTEELYTRLSAKVGSRLWSKLSMTASLLCDIEVLLEPNDIPCHGNSNKKASSKVLNRLDMFPSPMDPGDPWPEDLDMTAWQEGLTPSYPPLTQLVAVRLLPKKDVKIAASLDSYDWVTKKLFINRTKRIGEGIKTLGPGADEYILPRLVERGVDVSLGPGGLGANDLLTIVQLFDKWPFRPQDLFCELMEQLPGGAAP